MEQVRGHGWYPEHKQRHHPEMRIGIPPILLEGKSQSLSLHISQVVCFGLDDECTYILWDIKASGYQLYSEHIYNHLPSLYICNIYYHRKEEQSNIYRLKGIS